MVETPLNVSHTFSTLGCTSGYECMRVVLVHSALEISGNYVAEIDSNSDRLVRSDVFFFFFLLEISHSPCNFQLSSSLNRVCHECWQSLFDKWE